MHPDSKEIALGKSPKMCRPSHSKPFVNMLGPFPQIMYWFILQSLVHNPLKLPIKDRLPTIPLNIKKKHWPSEQINLTCSICMKTV